MNLLSTLFLARDAKRLAGIANSIADRCCAPAWRIVQHQVHGMTTAEARGYIRARTGRLVSLEVEQALARSAGLTGLHGAELCNLAKERLVETLVAEVERAGRTTTSHRRAA